MKLTILLLISLFGCSENVENKIHFPLPTFYFNEVPVKYCESNHGIYSQIIQGQGKICIDIEEFENFKDSIKYFSIYHEYCHLKLQTRDEYKADKCAIIYLYNNSLLSSSWFLDIYKEVSRWKADTNHPPGDLRSYQIFITYDKLRETQK